MPIGLFDAIIGAIDFFANLGLKQAKDAAELARIGTQDGGVVKAGTAFSDPLRVGCGCLTGKYYAVVDMLTSKPEEKYGRITLKEHFERIAKDGQEYDPYTTMFSGKKQ